jgi:hypothetical protein
MRTAGLLTLVLIVASAGCVGRKVPATAPGSSASARTDSKFSTSCREPSKDKTDSLVTCTLRYQVF